MWDWSWCRTEADVGLKLMWDWSWWGIKVDVGLKLMWDWSWCGIEADAGLKLMWDWSWCGTEADVGLKLMRHWWNPIGWSLTSFPQSWDFSSTTFLCRSLKRLSMKWHFRSPLQPVHSSRHHDYRVVSVATGSSVPGHQTEEFALSLSAFSVAKMTIMDLAKDVIFHSMVLMEHCIPYHCTRYQS